MRTIRKNVDRSDDMRKQNRERVLSAIRLNQPVSRTEIAVFTNLSPATVSAISAELLSEEIVIQKKVELPESIRRGRPQISLTLSPNVGCIVSLILQIHNVSAAIYDYAGNLLYKQSEKFDTSSATKKQILEALSNISKTVIENAEKDFSSVLRISLAVQGVTDVEETNMLWSPITDIKNMELKNELEAILDMPVRVNNDCNMIAAALRHSVTHDFGETFGMILLSHGIGMGLVMNSHIVKGESSSAMEFGHMSHIPDGAKCRCGRNGCIEAYAGDYAIVRTAMGLNPEHASSDVISQEILNDVLTRAENGDEAALKACHDAGSALGYGIANIFALMDPFPIAFVGKGTILFKYMEKAMKAAMSKSISITQDNFPSIACFENETETTETGCMISGLKRVDHMLAESPQHVGEISQHA